MTERWEEEEWEGVDLPPVKPPVVGESAGASNAGEHGEQMAVSSTQGQGTHGGLGLHV